MLTAIVTLIILVLSFVFAMLGLGGAMLYIPVFHWFSYDFKTVAIPTGLLLNGITALSAAIYYLKAKMVDVKGSVPLIVTSFIGAPIGAYFTRMVSTDILILLFAIAMIFAGGKMLFSAGKPEKKQMMPIKTRLVLMGIAGLFIGFIAGLLGVGGGFLFVPMMIAMGYETKIAAATSAFVVVFSSFSGFAGHVAEGHFDWPLMIATSIAVIVGSQIGAKVMKEKMKAKWIKQMFAVLLLGVAIKLLLKLYL
jgi:hypothetical protein